MKTIFLSGPIRDLERDVALSWRKEAEEKLSKNFKVLNPLRNREQKGTFPYPKGIVMRDKQDILSSDIILINDTFDNISMVGTAMEIIYAFEKDKYVILFGESHKNHPWIEYHSHIRFINLEEAINFINKMLV